MKSRALMAFAGVLVVVCSTIARTQELPDFGNRLEGLVSLPIGGPDRPAIDLVSFTGFFEPFRDPVDLRVSFFVPSSHRQVRIVAQELAQDRFYRMESKPADWPSNAWAVFGPWPSGDVIIPRMVRPSNIGVVVHLDDGPEGRTVIAPAIVEHRKRAATLTTYRVQLRPIRTTFSAVDYTFGRIDAGDVPPGKPTTLAGERPERRPFRIDLDAASLAEGRYLLTVVGYVKNSSTLRVTRQYEFEHRRLPR